LEDRGDLAGRKVVFESKLEEHTIGWIQRLQQQGKGLIALRDLYRFIGRQTLLVDE